MRLNVKYFLVIFLIFYMPFVLADEWDDFSEVDRLWEGQKTITNQEFEEVMDALQTNKNKQEEKIKKKKIKKISGGGTTLHTDITPDNTILELESLKKDENGTLINVPVNVIIDGKVLEKGYYNVSISKDKFENKHYINFYQSQFLKAKTEVILTDDDFGEKEINFAKIKEYKNSHALLIYGSIDFNGYVYLPYKE